MYGKQCKGEWKKFGEIVGSITLGAGKLLSTGLQIALLNWVRMSEFTADRAGLLTCQDPKVAATALMKLAGVPQKYFDRIRIDEFINQAKEFEDYDYDTLDKVAKYLSIMWQDHPWTVMRTSELFKWVESGGYGSIMKKYVLKRKLSYICYNSPGRLPFLINR
ncbi:MAG: M48 family metallopeptidase [Thermovenabulum sp.]|uniref:M48 family metallopeptidase n=1 Tax=Thermovenabulum sp. TaxID=3100335 RepID=UPI003C7B256A